MKKPTLKQQKTINKVREVMQDYPTGIPFNELMQKCLLSATATQHALGILGASESFDGLWRLPYKNDGANIQDRELNTEAPQASYPDSDQATHVSYHDNDDILVHNNDNLVDIDTDADQSSNGKASIKKKRNKPFTPNLTRGYEVQRDKVKIFLDRKASSKVLTLSLDDLKELVNAVEKSERVA